MSSEENKSAKPADLFLKVATWCVTEGYKRPWKSEIAWTASKPSYKLFSKEPSYNLFSKLKEKQK
jgi:hypothetical protein